MIYMQNNQNITLDVNNSREYQYIHAKQGDHNSRFLHITLTENGNQIVPSEKCRATFRCLKPDGKICFNSSILNEDGTITVCLTQQILAEKGTVRADVSLLEEGTVLSAATFFIMVEASPLSVNGALSSDEFLVLTEKTEEVDALKDEVMQAAERVETAENGLNALSEQLAGTEEDIAEINEALQNVKAGVEALNITTDIAEKALAKVETLEGCLGYTESEILGLSADYENNRFMRLAGAAGKNAGTDFDGFRMYGGRRRCTVTADGTITAFYGDENYTVEDKSVQVMVYQPKFYYRVVPLKLEKIENGKGYHIRKANYYVSDTPKAGFKLHPAFYDENGNEVEYILYSAYEGCYAAHYISQPTAPLYFNDAVHSSTSTNLNDDCIMSLHSEKPISGLYKNLTRTNAEKLCGNYGPGWHCETVKTLSANQMLMMIEFGALNAQQEIEKGVTAVADAANKNCTCYTGSANSLGNGTGHANASYFKFDSESQAVNYYEAGRRAVTYRGMENPWGNIWKWIQGVNVYGTTLQDRQMYICTDFNFKENTHTDNYKSTGCVLPEKDGYISAFGYGTAEFDWLFMPSETNGNSNLPVGDSWNSTSDTSKASIHRTCLYGGAWSTGITAGIFRISNLAVSNDISRLYGCRNVFIPPAQ